MSASPHPVRISVEEYLASSYRPDCDYVEGEVQERNLGEKEHAVIQRFVVLLFGTKARDWNIEVYPELRVQVTEKNYRVPDP